MISTKKALLAKGDKHALQPCCKQLVSRGFKGGIVSDLDAREHLGLKAIWLERVNLAQDLLELLRLDGRNGIAEDGAGLQIHANDVKMEPGVDLSIIAKSTPGASGADLANIINEAALRAVRFGRRRVTTEDLAESVDVVIAGAKKKNTVLSEHEKDVVAYHETGHAIVGAIQKNDAPVTNITIVPRTGGALGFTMQVEDDELGRRD